MIKYQEFINSIDFLSLQEGVKPKLEITEFKNIFGNTLFESNSQLVLEQAYTTYELGSLYENRRNWFETNTPIYSLNSGTNSILFKDNEIFIISKKSLRALREGFIDSVSSGWEKVKSSAKSSVNVVSSGAGKTWDAISDGAKKAYEFSARIVSAVVEFARAEPLEAIAIVLQILSGIIAFIPAAGQIIGPVLLGIAGALEVYGGITKSKEAWEKIKDIDISKLTKTKEVVSEGAPLIIAGAVSIALGFTDLIGGIKAAVPGAGAASLVAKEAAHLWEKTFVGTFAHDSEHFIVHTASNAAKKIGPKLVGPMKKFMGKGGSALGATLFSILLVNVGKGILGSLFDVFIKGLSGVATAFSFALSLPSKLSEGLKKVQSSVSSPIAKTVLGGIANFIQPAVGAVSKFVDTYFKPLIDSSKEYLETVGKESVELNKGETDKGTPVIKEPVSKVKPRNAEVSKDDIEKIEKLPKLKVQENLLSYKDFIRV